ncbi:IclR family transcriptional regulator [Pseudonocardia acaciae]|uniref:IclR family transcriptional regulator n=1 Tax=Pseudonocardia acaciae TaxID=551276 RepID=UPI00056D28C5|nr:IclR family transcriptional regulator [Pseudonocardia acaciae]
MAGNSPDAGRSVLSRALAVLGAFTSERPEHTLASIVQATGLSSATAYRLVAELVAWGALERVERGRYRIGIRLWRVGSLAPAARDLRDAALPFLQDLATATGHYVHLVVVDGHHALFVERLPGRIEAKVRSRVGRHMPLHASGPGKVLLAHSPAAFVDEVVGRGLVRLASGTITDRAALTRALADIRTTGYCVSRDEMTDGTSSVAAPVFGPTGEAVAGISVVLGTGTENPQLLAPVVRVTAAAISRALGAPAERFPLSGRNR